jgi:hypothetical protein
MSIRSWFVFAMIAQPAEMTLAMLMRPFAVGWTGGWRSPALPGTSKSN